MIRCSGPLLPANKGAKILDLQSGLKVAVQHRIKHMSRRMKHGNEVCCFVVSTGRVFLSGGSGGSGDFLRGLLL